MRCVRCSCNDEVMAPLHYQVEYGDNDAMDVAKEEDEYVTPRLHEAVFYGRREAVKVLMERGSDIDCVNDRGSTPIMYLIELWTDRPRMLQLLSRYKPDLDRPRNDGMNPLLLATHNKRIDIVRHLLVRGADIDMANKRGETSVMLACKFGYDDIFHTLINSGCDIKKRDNKGNNLLHVACLNGNLNMIKFVLNQGFDINCRNMQGATALVTAFLKEDNNEACSSYVSRALVATLLEHGADPNIAGTDGISALHLAANARDPTIFSILLCYGADVNAKSSEATTPLSTTNSVNNPGFKKYLCQLVIKWKTLRLVAVSDETMRSLHPDAPSFFRKYENKCKSELRRIKKFSKDLYLFLTNPIDTITYNIKNIDENYIYSIDCNDKFPLYKCIINMRWKRASVRFKLLQDCHKFSQWLENYFPYLCVKKILSYLGNGDLKSLSQM